MAGGDEHMPPFYYRVKRLGGGGVVIGEAAPDANNIFMSDIGDKL